MIPSASDVVRQRSVVAGLVRLVAVVIALYGFKQLVGIAAYATVVAMSVGPGMPFSSLLMVAPLIDGPVMLVLAVVLFRTAERLARRLVRPPQAVACPVCRYELRALAELRCPECGLVLDDAFGPLLRKGTPPHAAADSPMPE